MKNARLTIPAIMAIALTAGILWLIQGPVSSREATWGDVVAEAEKGGYQLISTDDLWKKYRVDGNRLLLIDTRQEWEYRSGHIRGAVNFPMEPTWFARWQKRGDLGRLLGKDKRRPIVFY